MQVTRDNYSQYAQMVQQMIGKKVSYVPVYGTGFLSKFYQKKKREAYKVTSLF